MEQKYFMWYDSAHRDWPIVGPFFYEDRKIIEPRCYHSLDELLKTGISDSLKRRLSSAKTGTRIKMHYLHSCGDMMVKRISDEQLKALKEALSLDPEIMETDKKLSDLRTKKKKILHKLYDKK
jgi:hypothetical protein